MQTNNIFSVGRLGLYLRKHLVDNYRFYGVSVIVLTGLLLFLLLLTLINDLKIRSFSELIPLYLSGLFLIGLIFTSMSFNELGNKSRGIDYLLFPASHLEKFLSTLIVTTIGFLLVYHLAFYLAAMAADAIMTVRTGHHMENDLFVDAKRNGWGYFYYAWFIMQAIFLLGAVYFHKYSFIKTMFCLFVFVLVLYMINAGFVNVFFHKHLVDWRSHFPFIGINVILENTVSEYTPSTHKFLMLPTGVRDVLLFGGKYLAVPVLWTLAFFRLRDKEM